MTTTSRRLSAKAKIAKPSHTPGKSKGGYCQRPKDHGLARLNPSALKGQRRARFDQIWDHYGKAKGNE